MTSQSQHFQPVTVRNNWYGNKDHNPNTATPPSYQFNFTLPDPLFTERASTIGTVEAFHGSALTNWHCILHCGLQSKSGTKEQTSGAIYGHGIYLSDELRVSRMFSKVSSVVWDHSMFGSKVECIGVYDVLNDESGVKMKRETSHETKDLPEEYYVVKDNTYLRLKSVLIWRDTHSLVTKTVKKRWYSDHTAILFYIFLLLAIVLSNMNWQYTKRTVLRLFNTYVAPRL